MLYCVYPKDINSSENIRSVRNALCNTCASLQESDLESGLNGCQTTITGSAHVLCVICDCSVQDINCLFKSCRPESTGLVNTMTIRWELTIQVHSGLCQRWQGDAKSRFMMELQIHHGCKKKKSSQQCLELFRPVRQSKWKDRLLLQVGYKLMQFRLNYFPVSVCLSDSFPSSLSCSLCLLIAS